MTHSEDFLRQMCKKKVVGEFPPFSEKHIFNKSHIKATEEYIKQIVGRVKDNHKIVVESDFNNLGSGFASYILVKISKRDKSATIISKKGNVVIEETKGIVLYISKLSPYWYYGAGNWSVSHINGKWHSASEGFLRPESLESFNNDAWGQEMDIIKSIFEMYRYRLLTQEEVKQELWFEVEIPTLLSESLYYQVFDCFFFWED